MAAGIRRHAALFTVVALAVLVDDLYARQARVLDPAERKRLVNEVEKIVLENAYHLPGLWWRRAVVHWAKVKNYVAPPNHYSNQKLQDVWLAED
jgi:peptide/nickel transport system substrate-binding protein